MFHTGIAWRHLPLEIRFGGGSTCDRRLDEWQRRRLGAAAYAPAFPNCVPPVKSNGGGQFADSSQAQAEKVSSQTGPSPIDIDRNGCKHQLLADATGIPFASTLTGGNRNDIAQAARLAVHAAGRTGSPPAAATTTIRTGVSYDDAASAQSSPRRRTEHGSGLGRVRWVVERTFAWLHHFKRQPVHYDRRHEIHEAFLAIGCCLVCSRRLQNL